MLLCNLILVIDDVVSGLQCCIPMKDSFVVVERWIRSAFIKNINLKVLNYSIPDSFVPTLISLFWFCLWLSLVFVFNMFVLDFVSFVSCLITRLFRSFVL